MRRGESRTKNKKTTSRPSSSSQSTKRIRICIEVFESLEQVGRLWLQQFKSSKGDSGMYRQMFRNMNKGKLHPSTKPSSCIYDEEEPTPCNQMFGVPATAMGNPPIDKTIILIIRLRTSCAGVLHKKKNRFVYDFFGHTFFLMDDVTKVLTVVKLEEKREVKLHKQIVK